MWQMSGVSCSSSEQGLYPELPDILELSGSSPSRAVFGLCSYTGHTSVAYAPSELTLTHMTNVESILYRPYRVHLELPDIFELLDSDSSRAHLEIPNVPERL
jgi:hypothetical protein